MSNLIEMITRQREVERVVALNRLAEIQEQQARAELEHTLDRFARRERERAQEDHTRQIEMELHEAEAAIRAKYRSEGIDLPRAAHPVNPVEARKRRIMGNFMSDLLARSDK